MRPAIARARRAAGPCLCLALALLAGCASAPQSARLTDRPPAALPPAAELRAVPFFAQERYQCGPAALAMVLGAIDHPVEPAALVDEVYVPGKQGSLATEMRAAARARGAVAYPLAPRLEDLLRELADGRPVLVMQNLGLDWWPRWHFAVAVGYDLREEVIVLRSGLQRRRVTDLAVFERTWARADRWAQVIVEPDRPPATAAGLPWLRSVRDLEQTAGGATAAPGYRVATLRWPRLAPAWLALGNNAWDQGRTGVARNAFRRAIELRPESAAAWNNLAHALAGDCERSAREAARCAARLAPDDTAVRDTLETLEGAAAAPAGTCPLPEVPAGEE